MCGGAMEFDPAQGMLHCPYCEHRMEIDNSDAPEVSEQVFRQAEFTSDFVWGEQQKQVCCRSCGAVTIYDALETSGVCSFCGSNQVMDEAVDTSLPPNGICPFEVTKDQAAERFKRWIKKRIFAPRSAKKNARAEAFDGIYVPYWTFDTQTSSDYAARYGRRRTVRDRKGNTRTVTDWYRTSGHYDRFVDDQLINASTRNDEKTMRKLEPYDLEQAKPFNPNFLSGVKSERYSVGLESGWEKAKEYIGETLKDEITDVVRRSTHADVVDDVRVSTAYSDITYKYLLLPIWKSSFSHNQKKYDFIVNGQTGKVSGKTPISAIRVAVAVIIAIALLAMAVFIFDAVDSDIVYDDYYYFGSVEYGPVFCFADIDRQCFENSATEDVFCEVSQHRALPYSVCLQITAENGIMNQQKKLDESM